MKPIMSNPTMKKKLIFFMVSIIFVPVFLLNTLFSYLYIVFYNGKIDDGYRTFKRESLSNLNYKLELYQAMLDRTVYDKNISAAIANIDTNKLITAYNASVIIDSEIDNITFGNAMEEVHNFFIVPYDKNIRAVGRYMSSMRNFENEDWIKQMDGRSKYIFIEQRIGNELLSFAQVMYYTDAKTGEMRPIAIAKMEINLDSILANSIKDMEASAGIEITMDGKLCYQYGNTDSQKKRYTFSSESSLLDENFKIRYIFDKTSQKIMSARILAAFLAAGAVILSVLIIIIVRFSDNISNRIAVILDKISKIEMGDFNVSKTLDGKDEFADIDERIVKMAKKIEQTINENYIIEAEKKRAQLLALRMQINPHFMFNTLETINSLAKKADEEEIGLISRKMAEILRYNIGGDCDTVDISEEFEHIKSYLVIQKIRHNDSFEAFYDISEEAKGCRVPKFILQPIVENIIKHAMTCDNEKYFISLGAKIDGDNLIISVNDDGDGIPADKLEKIRKSLSENVQNGDFGIGLRNVHLRLKITYGDGYGISVSSREHIGTSVILKIPVIKREEKGTVC